MDAAHDEALVAIEKLAFLPVHLGGHMGAAVQIGDHLPLEAQGISGVIVGRALYDGRVDLREALQAIGPGRWQDVPEGRAPVAWRSGPWGSARSSGPPSWREWPARCGSSRGRGNRGGLSPRA